MQRARALALFLALLYGCSGYRPARFADKPPVVDMQDDAPIPVPRKRTIYEPLWLAEIYLRRPLMDILEAERIPEAGDVNSLDEVPRSSWFEPNRPVKEAFLSKRPGSPGPPRPPLRLLGGAPTSGRGGARAVDSRGIQYELRVDPADRPGMRTAAEVIASRLLWSMGYLTPEAFITHLRLKDFATKGPGGEGEPAIDIEAFLASGPAPRRGRYRMSATLWPMGIEVGPAPISKTRDDDPNDLVAHRDRRTLRALGVVATFLKLSTIGPHSIADIYVGPPDEGHLEHFLVGLDDALGAGDIVRPGDPEPMVPALGPLESLFTLGLSPSKRPPITQSELLAVGDYPQEIASDALSPLDPYEPIERLLPADGYWAAKRIAKLSRRQLVFAVRAADLDDPVAGAYLVDALGARREALVARWYRKVSPLEVEGFKENELLILDRAITDGIVKAGDARYLIDYLDDEGRALADPERWRTSGERFRLKLPEAALESEYLVVRIVAIYEGKKSPRGFEAHWAIREGKPRLVGVRH